MNGPLIQLVQKIKHSPIRNYIIPGLTSWLIRDHGDNGMVRLFEMTRHQIAEIAQPSL